MSASDATLICLTPVKNEAWILDRFLQCASTWADHIIVADQHSDDGSREIASSFEKVTLIENPSTSFNEPERQKLLIDAARDIPCEGRRVLVALDADEVVSANWMTSPDWTTLRTAPPGTVFHFQWINLVEGVEQGWLDPAWHPYAFVDDGSPHVGHPIHSPRVPVPDDATNIRLPSVRILHYPYTNWSRMKSKQRWYQCYERLTFPDKRAAHIYRQYHDMDVNVQKAQPLDPDLVSGYEEMGIDMRSVPDTDHYYWDDKVLTYLEEHGPEPFRRLDIWDEDWGAFARSKGLDVNGEYDDPRSPLDRAIHGWLEHTQARHDTLPNRILQKLLQLVGW
jgi:glycosyltransferase involved in cell wall biosynthesis